jgi:TolA-binding protein
MKNSYRINYIFLLLSIGIVSTILSNPVLGQTQNNSQNQQGEKGSTGPYTSGKPGIESAQELESITNDTNTRTSNDTTPMFEELGKETQSGNQTAGAGQQQGNQTAGAGQQQGNQTAGAGQQQGNQTAGAGQEGNQSDNPLSNVGKAIGDLFK